MPDPVRYEVHDRVAVLTIDNPPVNALSPAMWDAIDHAVQRAVADPAADAIVLVGAGTTFIAGADIKVFDDLTSDAIAFAKAKAAAHDVRKVRDIPLGADAATSGLAACAKMRESLAKTARGMRAPFAAVDAIEAGLKHGFDAGSIREREIFA